jgi:pyrroloquinoline quinone biosynthesis protein E
MLINKLYRIVLRAIYRIDNEYLYRFLRKVFSKSLSKVLIHITDKCNYGCRYCYVERKKASLKKEEWFDILEQARRLGVTKISILGGEPFCEPYLEELIRRIKRLRMKPYLYTNGSLLTEEWMDKLVSYNCTIVFKYDYNQQVYHYHTCQDKMNFSELERKIKLCSEKGIRVITFTTLLKKNIGYVEKIFKRSLSLGALPAFERFLPVRDEMINEIFEVSDQEYKEAMSKIKRLFSKFHKEWSAAVRIAGRSCGCYSDIVSITPSGETLPCPYLPETESMGNIRFNCLEKIQEVLKSKLENEFKKPSGCLDCKNKFECAGGCYTYSFLKTGEYNARCKDETTVGFCAYLLADLYSRSERIDL